MGKDKGDRIEPSDEVVAEENGADGDQDKNHDGFFSNSEVRETGVIKNDIIKDQVDGEKEENKHTVPFYKLFAFADSIDIILMIMGSVGALANGAALPIMTILFGNLIQSFGGAADIHDVVHRVSKVSLEFIYLAIGSGVASFFQVACWIVTGERQAARIRNLYLKTILRQEIAFFDMETNTGEVVGRMSGDTVLIQDAMGEKVGKFIQLMSTFFGGFIVAFVQGWLLSLVMISIIPLLAVAGAIMSIVVSRMASKGQTAYGDASAKVEEKNKFGSTASKPTSILSGAMGAF